MKQSNLFTKIKKINLVVIILIVILGGYFYTKRQNSTTNEKNINDNKVLSERNKVKESGWETYAYTKYGFSMDIPPKSTLDLLNITFPISYAYYGDESHEPYCKMREYISNAEISNVNGYKLIYTKYEVNDEGGIYTYTIIKNNTCHDFRFLVKNHPGFRINSTETNKAKDIINKIIQSFSINNDIEQSSLKKTDMNKIFESEISQKTYSVTVPYNESLDEIIKKAKIINSDVSNINDTNFPSENKSSQKIGIKIINFIGRIGNKDDTGYGYTVSSALGEIDKLGYRPVTIRELLALSSKYPELQYKQQIFGLGSIALVDNFMYFPKLIFYVPPYEKNMIGLYTTELLVSFGKETGFAVVKK